MGTTFPGPDESFDATLESFAGVEPGTQTFRDALLFVADNVSGQVQHLIDTSDECDCGRIHEEPVTDPYTDYLGDNSSFGTAWGALSCRIGEYGEQRLEVRVTVEVTVRDRVEEPDCIVRGMPAY